MKPPGRADRHQPDLAEQGINIAAQYLQTSPVMGYVVIDIDAEEDVAEKALQLMKAIPCTIRARLLY